MKLTVDLERRSYDIVVKRGCLGRAGLMANLGRKVLVVIDDGVPQKARKTLLAQCPGGVPVVLPGGEDAKTIENWRALLQRMQAEGFGRFDAVAALGGGAVCNVAAFAAATYMHGVDCYLLPTTVGAQLEAAGSKSSLDLDGVPDALGACRPPRLVLADPDVLANLPARPYASGMALALKTALIGSSELFSMLENGDPHADIERILYLALRYRVGILQRDEAETGTARVLAFGQTFGCAIAGACGRPGGETPLYGECIALGMLPMIESRTLQKRTRAVMKKLGLPTRPPCPANAVMEHVHHSPRREGTRYTIARVKALGHGYLDEVDFEELALLLKEVF